MIIATGILILGMMVTGYSVYNGMLSLRSYLKLKGE